jgi:hypothetical protein
MRNNKKRYDKKVKMIVGENKEKEKQDKHVILEVHDSNLNSKSNDVNGGK